MSDNMKIAAFAAASAIIVAASVRSAYKTHKIQKAIRNSIKLNSKEEIEAMRKAAEIVQAKLRNGDYDNEMSIEAVFSDLEIYTIVSR